MSILIISDLHLDETRPEITERFFRLLREATEQAKSLYILGDLFEFWMGDDDLSHFNLSIMNAFKHATDKGLPVYVMFGNRDFLLGKKFFRATGCKLLPDEYIADIYGVPTLLMHGDTLCTQDVKYLQFRKKVRNWFVQKLFLMKSLKTRRAIVTNHRKKSHEHMSTLAEHIMDVTPEEVLRVMQKHHVQHLIHGHTHRQAVHQLSLDDKLATRTVLGAWHEHGNALVCNENGKREFIIV